MDALFLNAQQRMHADSLWCVALQEVIKAASLDIITVELSYANDSADVRPFVPKVQLSNLRIDTIEKKYGKVTYRGLMYPPTSGTDKAMLYWRDLKGRVKNCLDAWTLEEVTPAESNVLYNSVFTNSEDETTVRVRVVKERAYKVLLQVF